ncbi:methylated-DNA--[protein]-cysteine S-methyltransferase [Candidatus Dependentiae bacterium]|nr:methylated-DNA--[protein]-cysteine S-methyltransferase [Candidatus Dependentiae bacterium]
MKNIHYAPISAAPKLHDEEVNSFLSQLCSTLPRANNNPILFAAIIATPLGSMLALADEQALYFLDFLDHPKLERRVAKLQKHTKSIIVQGSTPMLDSIKQELDAYFATTLRTFTTPLALIGSTFQKETWQALLIIPYGITISYKALACSLSKPTAFRAVANANGANNLALIIPCHRVIASDGSLGGYGSGVARKQKLIVHEQVL